MKENSSADQNKPIKEPADESQTVQNKAADNSSTESTPEGFFYSSVFDN